VQLSRQQWGALKHQSRFARIMATGSVPGAAGVLDAVHHRQAQDIRKKRSLSSGTGPVW
jgi:hypothetical protein